MNYEKMKREAQKNTKEFFACPDPWCAFAGSMERSEILKHYEVEHACSTCKRGKHSKCKAGADGRIGLCGCVCRQTVDRGGRAFLTRVMIEAARLPKVAPKLGRWGK